MFVSVPIKKEFQTQDDEGDSDAGLFACVTKSISKPVFVSPTFCNPVSGNPCKAAGLGAVDEI